jgi:hypothetical protein
MQEKMSGSFQTTHTPNTIPRCIRRKNMTIVKVAPRWDPIIDQLLRKGYNLRRSGAFPNLIKKTTTTSGGGTSKDRSSLTRRLYAELTEKIPSGSGTHLQKSSTNDKVTGSKSSK